MGHFGFSYVGLLFLLMVTIPNLVWARNRPKGYSPTHENRVLVFLERVGQACVFFVALIFSDFNLRLWSLWSLWLVAAVFAMLFYEVWWARYFLSEKTLRDFYSPILGVPVAGATLPVLGFFLLGIYGKVAWMMVAVAVLGVGHIGIHLQHRREIFGA